jgi:hypothetical protein
VFQFILGVLLGTLAGIIASHHTTALYAALLGGAVALLIWFGIDLLDAFF